MAKHSKVSIGSDLHREALDAELSPDCVRRKVALRTTGEASEEAAAKSRGSRGGGGRAEGRKEGSGFLRSNRVWREQEALKECPPTTLPHDGKGPVLSKF